MFIKFNVKISKNYANKKKVSYWLDKVGITFLSNRIGVLTWGIGFAVNCVRPSGLSATLIHRRRSC